jgi:tetratricopeptide (TPR) repeat protein
MKIFKPMPGKKFERSFLCDVSYSIVFIQLNGSSLSAYWQPIKFERVTKDIGMVFDKPSDFPWYGSEALVMREKARDLLEDIFNQNGEILPLETDDDVKLFVFNCQVINALDEERSDLERFKDGRIMWINKYEFIKSKLLNTDMFRIPLRASSIFVSERFVERYKSAGLVGLEFEEVWDSDISKSAEFYKSTDEPNPNPVNDNDGDNESFELEPIYKLSPESSKEECEFAIEYCKNYIKSYPNEYGAYENMGYAYFLIGDYGSCAKCYEKLAELKPEQASKAKADMYYNIGTAYLDKENYDRAIELFGKVIELNPDAMDAHYNMGNASFYKNDIDGAIACYKKAIKLDSEFPDVYYNMGMAYAEKGDNHNASKYMEKAKKLGYEPE